MDNLHTFFRVLICTFLIVITTPVSLFSQSSVNQRTVDSLLSAYENASYEDQFEIVMHLSAKYYEELPDRGIKKLNAMLKLAKERNDYKKSAACLNSLGIRYGRYNFKEEALTNFLEALEMAEKIPDSLEFEKVSIFSNIGALFADSDPDKSLEYFYRALDYSREQKDTILILSSMINIGFVFEGLENTEQSNYYHNDALAMAEKFSDGRLESFARICVGRNLIETSKYDEAEIQLNLALKIAREINAVDKKAWSFFNLGVLNLKMRRFNNARTYLDSAIVVYSKLSDNQHLIDCYETYIEYSELTKDSSLLVKYLKKYNTTKEIKNEKISSERLHIMKVKFETERIEQSLILANSKNEILSKESEMTLIKNHRMLIALLLLAILLAALLIIMRLRTKAIRQNKLIFEKGLRLKDAELKNKALINEKLRSENELKKRELTGFTLEIQEKNQLITQINGALDKYENSQIKESDLLYDLRSLTRSIHKEEDWNLLKLHFESVHPNFFDELLTISERLSATDLRHCAYIKLNLTTKEIASLFNITARSVQISRGRLKKKLEIDKEIDLHSFISRLHTPPLAG